MTQSHLWNDPPQPLKWVASSVAYNIPGHTPRRVRQFKADLGPLEVRVKHIRADGWVVNFSWETVSYPVYGDYTKARAFATRKVMGYAQRIARAIKWVEPLDKSVTVIPSSGARPTSQASM